MPSRSITRRTGLKAGITEMIDDETAFPTSVTFKTAGRYITFHQGRHMCLCPLSGLTYLLLKFI